MNQMPSHWNRVPLGGISSVVTGRTPATSEVEYWDGSIPFITPGDLNGNLISTVDRTITQSGLEVSRGLSRGTVLVSCIGYIGKVGMVDCPVAVTNQQINAVIPDDDKVSNWYLLFAFMFLETYLNNLSRITTVPILNKSNFEAALIPLPPLPEQRAIARALRAVQAAREARQREATLERERKAALMEHLFTHGTRGEARKQTPIGEMPESWEVVAIGKRCVVKTSFPSFKKIPEMDTGNDSDKFVLALKVSDMTLPGNEKFISNSKISFRHPATNLQRFLKPNSVVFPKRGAAIATNKKRLIAHFAILDPNLIAVEPPPGIDSEYLFAFFERFDLRTLQANNPIPQLNKHNVEAVNLALPSPVEQKEISKVLGACDVKIVALDREIALLDEFFQALLEELMTGQVSVGGVGEEEPSL